MNSFAFNRAAVLLCAAAILTATLSTLHAQYSSAVLADNPLAYWRLGETMPPSVFATNIGTLGSAGNGTNLNGVSLGQAGVLAGDSNRAVNFNRTLAQKIDVPYSPSLNSTQFTIECWVRATAVPSDFASPITSRQSSPQRGYIFYATSGSAWQFWAGNGSGWTTLGGATLVLQKWFHLVGTYDGATLRFYTNGVQASSAAMTYIPNQSSALRIGGGQSENAGNFFFPGDIDEVAYYSNALSATQITNHYQSALSAASNYFAVVTNDLPVGYWRVGEPALIVATNRGSLGTAGDGTLFNTALTNGGALAGSTDTAQAFNTALSAKIDVSFNAALNPAIFTVECWAYPTGGIGAFRAAVSSRNSGAVSGNVTRGYILYATSGNNWELWVGNGIDGNWRIVSGGSVTLSNWMHLTGTYDGTTIRLYTNGILANSVVGTIAVNNLNPLRIGAGQNEDFGSFFFPGRIDEVAVYQSALSASQILTHYQSATTSASNYFAAITNDLPVGYWRLSETPLPPTPSSAVNIGSLGSAANGFYSNNPAIGRPGALTGDANSAYGFNGVNTQKVEVPYLAGLNSNVFTVEAWAKPAGGAGTFRAPVSSRNETPTTFGYALYASSTNTWEFWSGASNSGNWAPIVGPAATIGQWAHLVGTYDGTNKLLYVNGALYAATQAVFAANAARPFRIGAGRNETNTGDYFFNGDVDEVAYYGTVLNPDRVLAHYTNGSGSLPAAVAAGVLRPPQSRTNAVGSTSGFTVIPRGSLPFTYQWRLNGTNVTGATGVNFNIASTQMTNAGGYDVIISNSAGSVTSSVATLYLLPFFTLQPQSTTATEGGSASFTVLASGTGPLTYQWQKNGSDIAGATNATLLLNPLTTADEAIYRVRAINVAGSTYSDSATLTVIATGPPVITLQPRSRTVFSNGVARFLVQAIGSPLSYQWQFAGGPLSNETNAALGVTNVTAAQAGDYTVVVANNAGSTTSTVATLTVSQPPSNSVAGVFMNDLPAGYWRLGESAGPFTFDSFGGHDGGYSNSVTLGVQGALSGDSDTAAHFDAVSAKADVPWAVTLNQTNFTVTLWARVTNTALAFRSPLSSRGDSPTRGYIFYASTSNYWEFWTGTGGGPGTWHAMSSRPVVSNEWVQLAGSYDGTTKRFYLNGMLVGSANPVFAPNTDKPLRIGAGASDLVTGNFYFPGDVDEVVVYPSALPASHIADQYAAGRARFNNHAPVAVNDDAGTIQGRAVSIATVKLVANDIDSDGDLLSVLSVTSTSTNGAPVTLSNNTVTYTPAAAFTGTDAFSYTVTDGYAATSTGLIVVTVTSSNAVGLNVVYGPVLTNGNFQVRFAGVPSYTYTVEFTDTLFPPQWQKATNAVAPANDLGAGIGIFEWIEPTGVSTQRFYRTIYPSY